MQPATVLQWSDLAINRLFTVSTLLLEARLIVLRVSEDFNFVFDRKPLIKLLANAFRALIVRNIWCAFNYEFGSILVLNTWKLRFAGDSSLLDNLNHVFVSIIWERLELWACLYHLNILLARWQACFRLNHWVFVVGGRIKTASYGLTSTCNTAYLRLLHIPGFELSVGVCLQFRWTLLLQLKNSLC